MSKRINLNAIYSLRTKFTIIGLTGRTGSGCSEVAMLLGKGFDETIFRRPQKGSQRAELNTYRKYRIIYNYAKENFKPYKIIIYKHVLTWFILREPIENLISYLDNSIILKKISIYFAHKIDYQKEIDAIKMLEPKFNEIRHRIISADSKIRENKYEDLFELFFSEEYISFSNEFHEIFNLESCIKHNKFFQLISNSLRRESTPYSIRDGKNKKAATSDNIYCIATLIDQIIESVRDKNEYEEVNSTRVVIDSLRNPLEIMYFKEKYSAFYMFSVQRDNDRRKQELKERFIRNDDYKIIERIEEEEHKRRANHEFYKQDVSECIQKADIHLEFITELECQNINTGSAQAGVRFTPRTSYEEQLLRYIALIGQPGIVTPTAEERCMQIAYTAKYNSGCISRQVGALVADENYSIKALGWNDVADGQIPCSLRNIDDYLNKDDENDFSAYSTYEKNNEEFNKAVVKHYNNKTIDYKKNLNGRNVCFCFKSLQNHITEGKNQIHTRALHAEENAFLQIVKYGGQGVINGKLFSTASPCESCSKKAYQLNIKTIYFIDTYPGIAVDHILRSGDKPLELRHFIGAIGKAYHKFYEPFMPYKDELSLLLDIEIEDLTTRQSKQISNM